MQPAIDLRDAPTPEFIAALRSRYRVEPEVDRMLTRKMQRRPGAPHTMVTLDQLTTCLTRLLEHEIGSGFRIEHSRWLAGGASKLQMRFTLHWVAQGTPTVSNLVVRMEPTESLNASSRLREFQLLEALHGSVPVPKVYWVDADGQWFPEPALVYAFAEGVAKPTRGGGAGVSWLGSHYGPRLRALLAPQFVEWLARIHTVDPASLQLSAFVQPEVGSTIAAAGDRHRDLVWCTTRVLGHMDADGRRS